MHPYTMIGHIKTGEAIYYNKPLGLAIEKDHEVLVCPSPEEEAEIYEIFPHLKPTN